MDQSKTTTKNSWPFIQYLERDIHLQPVISSPGGKVGGGGSNKLLGTKRHSDLPHTSCDISACRKKVVERLSLRKSLPPPPAEPDWKSSFYDWESKAEEVIKLASLLTALSLRKEKWSPARRARCRPPPPPPPPRLFSCGADKRSRFRFPAGTIRQIDSDVLRSASSCDADCGGGDEEKKEQG